MREPDRAVLAAARLENARARRLAPQTLAEVRATGVLDGLLPTELAANGLAARTWLATLETLAAGDPAAGWVAMTASTSTLLAPYIAREMCADVWGNGAPAPVIAGVFAPSGRLDAAGRLVGRWSFASGCRHAAWFALGALDDSNRHVVALLPAAEVAVVDNWDTLGLGGTGSHDVTVDALVTPRQRATVIGGKPWTTTGALAQVPLFGALAAGVAACALGIARGALEMPMPEPSSAQLAGWAAAHARVAAGRAYLHAAIAASASPSATGATLSSASATAPTTDAARGELRLAAIHAANEAAEAVHALFRLAGGGAIRANHPLELALRDVETARSHRMVGDRVVPTAARAILGLGPTPPDL